MSYNNMTPDALAIADHMNQYIAGNNIECAARLEQIKYNPKIENKLDYEQWDLVIDYVYQNLLAHSMEDGIISDVEKVELAKLQNLKAEFKNTTKEAIKYRLTNAVVTVEKSHDHNKFPNPYSPPKPTPWDNQDKK